MSSDSNTRGAELLLRVSTAHETADLSRSQTHRELVILLMSAVVASVHVGGHGHLKGE